MVLVRYQALSAQSPCSGAAPPAIDSAALHTTLMPSPCRLPLPHCPTAGEWLSRGWAEARACDDASGRWAAAVEELQQQLLRAAPHAQVCSVAKVPVWSYGTRLQASHKEGSNTDRVDGLRSEWMGRLHASVSWCIITTATDYQLALRLAD